MVIIGFFGQNNHHWIFHLFSSSLVVLLMIRSGVATVERQVNFLIIIMSIITSIIIIIIIINIILIIISITNIIIRTLIITLIKMKRVSQSLADCPRWDIIIIVIIILIVIVIIIVMIIVIMKVGQ